MAQKPPTDLGRLLTLDTTGAAPTASLGDFWGGSLAADAAARMALAAEAACPGQVLRSLRFDPLAPAPPARALRVATRVLRQQPALCEVSLEDEAPLARAVVRLSAPSSGLSHSDGTPPADLPDPETLPSTLECARSEGWEDYAAGPLEFRRIGPLWPDPEGRAPTPHMSWMKPRGDGAVSRQRAAAVVFLGLFYPHWGFERRLGEKFDQGGFALLGATVWLHGLPSFDDWWLLRDHHEVAADGLGLTRRRLFTRDGTLAAEATLEARVART